MRQRPRSQKRIPLPTLRPLSSTFRQIYSSIKFSRTFLIQSWMRAKSTLHAHWLSKNDVVKKVRKDGTTCTEKECKCTGQSLIGWERWERLLRTRGNTRGQDDNRWLIAGIRSSAERQSWITFTHARDHSAEIWFCRSFVMIFCPVRSMFWLVWCVPRYGLKNAMDSFSSSTLRTGIIRSRAHGIHGM